MLRLPPPERGALFVVSGPSGAGKSTLIAHVRACVPDLAFSVSATTRAPRAGEQDGVHYHFVDEARYAALVAEDAFLEHARVYGHGYGTLRAPILEALGAGRSVLLDIDAQGSAQVRRTLPEAVHVIVVPPDLDALERRLRGRGSEDDAVVARRMRDAGAQLAAAPTYDHVVVNDDLEAARTQLLGVVLAELARTSRHGARLDALLAAWQSRCNG